VPTELGRRIERLFYFGAILIVLCVIQTYLTTTLSYIRSKNPVALSTLSSKVEADMSHLQKLYGDSIAPPTADPQRERLVQSARSTLGLPQRIAPKPPAEETYKNSLDKLLTETSLETGMDSRILYEGISSKDPPEKVLENIQSKERDLATKPVNVWGIETPLQVPLQYGKAEYQIPISAMANSLRIALAMLLIGWLGSLYLTRQRELLLIRNMEDYKLIFPHILNVLPVVDLSSQRALDNELTKRKEARNGRTTSRLITSIVRTAIIGAFCAPVLFMFSYSELTIADLSYRPSLTEVLISLAAVMVMFVQSSLLVLQEWVLLWSKFFYVRD
jgi:hypothetical protein